MPTGSHRKLTARSYVYVVLVDVHSYHPQGTAEQRADVPL
jgi:hypothetical protein